MAKTDAPLEAQKAERIIKDLASLLEGDGDAPRLAASVLKDPIVLAPAGQEKAGIDPTVRAVAEQARAIIFVALVDKDIREAYVSPQVESVLGFPQREWLDDPTLWYRQLHPEDKQRWSHEAARMLASGEPLFSTYRVIARDGRIVWLQCDAKMVRSESGKPWFIHGLALDITAVREIQANLQIADAEIKKPARELDSLQVHSQQTPEHKAAEQSLRQSEER